VQTSLRLSRAATPRCRRSDCPRHYPSSTAATRR
jgi:hypothetical protein